MRVRTVIVAQAFGALEPPASRRKEETWPAR
jgi:hypothetical protein